jgi:hypothetical protein
MLSIPLFCITKPMFDHVAVAAGIMFAVWSRDPRIGGRDDPAQCVRMLIQMHDYPWRVLA